jgi:ABC-2 type transport system permease protein
VFLIGTGYFFNYNIFLTVIAAMDDTFQNMGMLLLVLSPVISMRLFAGEYAAGTMELLATLPIRPWQVVTGKYLGAVTLLSLMAAGTLVDLIPLYLFGDPDTLTIASGYLGFMLLGMTCLAIGQFFSALTENQIVAALLTVSVLLGFWFIGNLHTFQSSYTLHALFRYLSFSGHFADFIQGLVRGEGVVFYLMVSGIALVLNASYLEWRR